MFGVFVFSPFYRGNACKAGEVFRMLSFPSNENAICNFGLLYEGGEAVPKDLNKAFELYLKIAEKGHIEGI
jgi:TPR repeat protein